MNRSKEQLKDVQSVLVTIASVVLFLLLFFKFNVSISKKWLGIQENDFATSIDILIFSPVLVYFLNLIIAVLKDIFYQEVLVRIYIENRNNKELLLLPPTPEKDNSQQIMIDVILSKKEKRKRTVKFVIPQWMDIQIDNKTNIITSLSDGSYEINLSNINNKGRDSNFAVTIDCIAFSNFPGKNTHEIGVEKNKGKFYKLKYESIVFNQGD